MLRPARTYAAALAATALGTLFTAPAVAQTLNSPPGGSGRSGSGSGSGGASLSSNASGSSADGSGQGSSEAGTGAGGTSGTSGTTGSTGSDNPLVGSGNTPVTASGAGISITTTASTLLRNQLAITGTVPSGDAGRTVEIERLGHQTNWTWQPTTHATVDAHGGFSADWTANHIGQFSLRAVVLGGGARAASASPTVTVTVYRPSIATWYGPGFFGTRTACGVRLTPRTFGVANRTLPCGTEVALEYQGRTVTVPVIDRGPYANHADWDLTQATSQALGITETVTLGAVSLPQHSGS